MLSVLSLSGTAYNDYFTIRNAHGFDPVNSGNSQYGTKSSGKTCYRCGIYSIILILKIAQLSPQIAFYVKKLVTGRSAG